MSAPRISRSGVKTASGAVGVGVGAGVGLAIRQWVDVFEGQEVSLVGDPDTLVGRVTRPSVVYGLGGAGFTGVLWAGGMGPPSVRSLWLGHALAALPVGVFSLLAPRQATTPTASASSASAAPASAASAPCASCGGGRK